MMVEVEVVVRLPVELEDEPVENAPDIAKEIVEEALAEYNTAGAYGDAKVIGSTVLGYVVEEEEP